MNYSEIIRPPMRLLPPGKADIRRNADFITRFVCNTFRRFVARIPTGLGAGLCHDSTHCALAGRTGPLWVMTRDDSRVPAWAILTAASPVSANKKMPLDATDQ